MNKQLEDAAIRSSIHSMMSWWNGRRCLFSPLEFALFLMCLCLRAHQNKACRSGRLCSFSGDLIPRRSGCHYQISACGTRPLSCGWAASRKTGSFEPARNCAE